LSKAHHLSGGSRVPPLCPYAEATGISRKCVHTWMGVRFVDRSNRNLAYSVPRVSKVLCLLRCLSIMLRRRERAPATVGCQVKGTTSGLVLP